MLGRADELGTLLGLVGADDARIVSVVGAPGVGKTLLAATAAREISRHRPVAALCVDAGDIDTYVERGIRAEVAAASELGARCSAARSLVIVDAADTPRRDLQLALQSRAAGVVLVARGAMRRRDETRLPVAPLPSPEPGGAGLRSPAVELLVRRVEAVRPDLAMTEAARASLGSIARLCGGIPLALELAARRLRVLTPEELLLRLREPLAVLSGGGAGMPARQRSLGTTLDGLWAQLEEQPRRLAMLAALLQGDLSVDELEGLARHATPDLEVLAAADALVDAGLLVRAPAAGTHRMPWPWRAHALERLDSSAEARLRRALVPALVESGGRRPTLATTVAARAAVAGDPAALRLVADLPGAPAQRDVSEGPAVLPAFLARLADAAVAAEKGGAAGIAWLCALITAWAADQLRLTDVRDHMLAIHNRAMAGEPAHATGSARDSGRHAARLRVRPSRRVLATVLYASLSGASGERPDEEWLEVVRTHDSTLRALIGEHRGYEARLTGVGGAIALFDGPAAAVRCGGDLLATLRSVGITGRAGVHIGEVDVREEDVVGLPVHVAARVAARAAPGALLVTEVVRDASAGSGLDFEPAGRASLKGIPGEWPLYRVAPHSTS